MNFLPKSHIFAAIRGNPDSKIGTLKTFFAKSNPCDCNIGTFDARSSTFDGKSSLFAGKLGLYQDEKGVSGGPPQTTCSCFGVSNSHREGGRVRTNKVVLSNVIKYYAIQSFHILSERISVFLSIFLYPG